MTVKKDVGKMKVQGKIGLGDLIISYGGMLIVSIGIGLMFLISYFSKSTALNEYANLIGVGASSLFIVVAFASYYQTVNHKKENKE